MCNFVWNKMVQYYSSLCFSVGICADYYKSSRRKIFKKSFYQFFHVTFLYITIILNNFCWIVKIAVLHQVSFGDIIQNLINIYFHSGLSQLHSREFVICGTSY